MLRTAACLLAFAGLACSAPAQGARGTTSGAGGATTGSSFGGTSGAGTLTGGATGAGQSLSGAAGGLTGAGVGGAGAGGIGGQTGTAVGFGEGLQAQNPGTFLGSGAGLNGFVGGAGGQRAVNAATGGTTGFGGGGGGGAAGPTRQGGARSSGNDPRLNIAVPLRVRIAVPPRSPAALGQSLARRAAILTDPSRFESRPGFAGLRVGADDAGVVTLSGSVPEEDRRLAAAIARLQPGVSDIREAYDAEPGVDATPAPRPPAVDAPVLLRTERGTSMRVLNP
ncbi:BON domain-containing protein [Alienimonas chondri]|uniref:BON domain-containing protein n=1 Tax=Alienimonas chondri TaxID=2681879 RepID=A0ABX1VC80_9PLAN|nr:BON domain-containing protein [Alienimonas chondri]NNJ25556.1 hypothetical protein [Alienimonas chondri]